jgi:acyl carrier protein
MKHHRRDQDSMPSQLKHLVVELFRLDIKEPDRIADAAPLLGGALGLDSLDALELAMSVEEKFGVTIGSHAECREAFASIASLASFIQAARRAPNFAYPIGPVAA